MISAILASLVFLSLTVGLQLKLKRVRQLRIQSLELTPNCLLTRHPILFIAGPRSLFRLFETWNEIPVFLREHGYEVFEFEPRYDRRSVQAKSVADQVRESLGALSASIRENLDPETLAPPDSSRFRAYKFHLIADSSCSNDLQELASVIHSQIASLTLAIADESPTLRRSNANASKLSAQPVALKPLAMPIHELHLSSSIETSELPANAQTRFQTNSRAQIAIWNGVASRLLTLHNWVSRFRNPNRSPVQAAAVGQFFTRNWMTESTFLKHAVELAEQDAQFSN